MSFLALQTRLSADGELQRELVNEGYPALLEIVRPLVSERASCSNENMVNYLLSLAWEKLHEGNWREVSQCWREIYALASFLKASLMSEASRWEECCRLCDIGLMLGGAETAVHSDLHAILQTAGKYLTCEDDNVKFDLTPIRSFPISHPISRIPAPSFERFLVEHLDVSVPVIMTGCLDGWNALSKWQYLSYWRAVAGYRTVPVEVGSNYLSEDWKQELMTLNEFFSRYFEASVLSPATKRRRKDTSASDKEIGYLAQHTLLEQIPELAKDIVIPDYCRMAPQGELQVVNIWLGPGGTVSPIHHDPYHNLLAQVVGSKYIRLYDPSQSEYLYAFQDGLLTNTSPVDVLHPDLKQFPQFGSAKYIDCELTAGDILYIPPKWWHYVQSLSSSCSVSFWFE
eukprot:GILK01008642.1.p1 GENE.GILK01008642.1~~GILK01008642.1.p1  ORF type:complete len:399 (+),score=33.91 GILK01008642.1:36-1232(+)